MTAARALPLAAALALAACSSAPYRAPADLQAAVSERYYDVAGSSAGELLADLNRQSLHAQAGPYFADFRWQVGWHIRYITSEVSGCRMQQVTVVLEGAITLPQWRVPAPRPPPLVRSWDGFVAATRTHEQGHADLARKAAQAIESALSGLTAPNCAQLQHRANDEGERIVAQYRELQERYDRDTEHGRAQGAVWPPV